MSFTSARYLLAAIILLPITLMILYHYGTNAKKISAIFNNTAASQKELSALKRRYVFSALCFECFILCVVIALAGPTYGFTSRAEFESGVDIVIALDISRSMDCKDVPVENDGAAASELVGAVAMQTRLERAVTIVKKLLLTLTQDNGAFSDALNTLPSFALTLGKGASVNASPLTQDREALLGLLDIVSSGALSSRGTNLEKLIDTAAKAFSENFAAKRVIIFLTDGESADGNLDAAFRRAVSNNISIVTIGIGGDGAPVPDTENTMSRLHEKELLSLYQSNAKTNDGVYISGNSPGALAEAENIIGFFQRSGGEIKKVDVPIQRELSTSFFFAAFLFLAASFLSRYRVLLVKAHR
jgi:Ca-activated chloride channel family protein